MSASLFRPRVGVWLIGARGSVATTVVAGCAAVTAGLHPPTGMVTETAALHRQRSARVVLPRLRRPRHPGLPAAQTRGGLAAGGRPAARPRRRRRRRTRRRRRGRSGRAARTPGRHHGREGRTDHGLRRGHTGLRTRHGLARAVVVNVASTEAAARDRTPGCRASSLYAAAALRAGCPYVNFTPSDRAAPPVAAREAECCGLPYAGRDGKTGQTLLRSVLGPMFAQRALAVRAWSGTNLLGGGDGAALADPAAAAAKNAGKERVLADTLGTVPEGEVHIDDVPALGDWKTAWDHIAFDGFLGARMILQTIWQGCDSALAAPLVLDLARLLARAHEAGLTGPLPELGFYFKDPVGTGPPALGEQYAAAGRPSPSACGTGRRE